MSDTPELTPERIWPYPWHLYPHKHLGTEQTEYVRADLHEAERARAEEAEAKLSNALRMLDEQDREYNRKTNTLIERHAEQISKQAAERDALAEKLAKVAAAYRAEAMRREAYSHEAFDRHIAEVTGTP